MVTSLQPSVATYPMAYGSATSHGPWQSATAVPMSNSMMTAEVNAAHYGTQSWQNEAEERRIDPELDWRAVTFNEMKQAYNKQRACYTATQLADYWQWLQPVNQALSDHCHRPLEAPTHVNRQPRRTAQGEPVISEAEKKAGLTGAMCTLSKHPEGTFEVQDALKAEGADEVKAALIAKLETFVAAAWKCPNAHHVLQCALQVGRMSDTRFIIDEMLPDVLKSARHKYGCRVHQRILEHGEPRKVAELVEALLSHADVLCRDENGKYVMEKIMEHEANVQKEHKSRLVQILLGNWFDLIEDENAPTVIQKVLEFGTLEQFSDMLEAFSARPESLYIMSSTRFGYNAAEAFLKRARPQDKEALLKELDATSQSWVKVEPPTFDTSPETDEEKKRRKKEKEKCNAIGRYRRQLQKLIKTELKSLGCNPDSSDNNHLSEFNDV